MIDRKNKLVEIAIKKAIKLSKTHSFTSARRVLEQANFPDHIVERVLFEPHNIRKTD